MSLPAFLEKETFRKGLKYGLLIWMAVVISYFLIGLSSNTGWSTLELGLNELTVMIFTGLICYFTVVQTRTNEIQYQMYLIEKRPKLKVKKSKIPNHIEIINIGVLPALEVKIFVYLEGDKIDNPSGGPYEIDVIFPESNFLKDCEDIPEFYAELSGIKLQCLDTKRPDDHLYEENIILEKIPI